MNKTSKCINPIWTNVPPKSNVPHNPTAPTTWFDMQNKLTGFYIPPMYAENWPKMSQILKKDIITVLMFCKFFVALITFYKKTTCFKKHLHRWQEQSCFHFLIFILNDDREVQLFIFWGTTALVFGAKKDMVSVP